MNNRFEVEDLEGDWVRVTITMQSPKYPTDKLGEVTGADAQKRFVKFVLASADGLLTSIGVDVTDMLSMAYGVIEAAVDTSSKDGR